MDLIDMLINATDLDKYNHVTNTLCESGGFDVKSNNVSVLRILENLHLMEIEYFYNYRKRGAAFILLEQLAEIEPSTHWIHISKLMIRILRQWLTKSTDLILKDRKSWVFVRHLMNIIFKIFKKCNNMVHLCEPIIVLMQNSNLNSNQKHELGECLNRISNNLTRNQRLLVQPNLVKHFPGIAAMIGSCGHFPCQYSLLEILIRWLLSRNHPAARREVVDVWFSAKHFSTRAKQIFLERAWDNFPKDARDFLNAANQDNKSVISVQIQRAKIGHVLLIRSAWWLDVNITSRSVSMMVPRKKLPMICGPMESYSVALCLSVDNTENITLQRIGNENIVTMSSFNSISLLPMQETTAWKTMILSVNSRYLEVLDKSLKQVFGPKYKALINIETVINLSQGETTNYYSESDFSRFSEPEKQNSSFAAFKRFATPNYTSEKVFSHMKPTSEAPFMSNFNRKVSGELNQAKSEITVGSLNLHKKSEEQTNDFNESKLEKIKLLTDTSYIKDDVRKRDTPSLTSSNRVEQLFSPLNSVQFRKEDSKNLSIPGNFDCKIDESFFKHKFTDSNIKRKPVIVDETPSDDLDTVALAEKHDVESEVIHKTPNCFNNEDNINGNNSILMHSEKKSAEESKLKTSKQYCNKKNMENGNTDIQLRIENKSIKLKDKETSVLNDKPKIFKKNSIHKIIKEKKPSSRLISDPLEPKHLPRKSVKSKPKFSFSDSLKISDNVAKNISVNNHDDKIDVYKYSYGNELLEQPVNKALINKGDKLHKTPAKYKTKDKEFNIIAEGAKGNDNEISKTTKKRNTKASINLRDEIMRSASTVQLNDSELVKVDTTDKVDEPEPVAENVPHMEITAENVGQENKKFANKKKRKQTKKTNEIVAEGNVKDICNDKKNRKRTKKTKETVAEGNVKDICTNKKLRKRTKKTKNIKEADSKKTPLCQLPTQIVKNETRDNEKVNISSDVTLKKMAVVNIERDDRIDDLLNKIEVFNDSSDGNKDIQVNVRTPKENDVGDALSVHDSSSSLTLKTNVASSTINGLDKTYEPRNLEYEYLKPRQKELLNDLLSTIDQESERYKPKRIDFLNTKAKELAKTKNIQLRVSVERTSSINISRESSHITTTKLKTNKKVNTNTKPTYPTVCVERISSDKIARILRESCHSGIRKNLEMNGKSNLNAKKLTPEARVTKERSPLVGNSSAHNRKRKLETPKSERCPTVQNTAQNEIRELVTPARTTKRCALRRRKPSVMEWVNDVDPRPTVSLSEQVDDMKKIVMEKIDTRLDEIQIKNTESTLNMCISIDEKLDEVFETQCDISAQRMDNLGKRFCNLLKSENHRATERWREAFDGLRREFKTISRDLVEKSVRERRSLTSLLRGEIENI